MYLRIDRQNNNEIWVYCPFHSKGMEKYASMIINLTGDFAGKYHCFACNADGKAVDLGLNMKIIKTPKKKKERKDWQTMWEIYNAAGYHKDVNQPNELALEWGVAKEVLYNYGYGWTGDAHCYPMCNEITQITGIQRRYENGRKLNITGSRLGLFLNGEDFASKVDSLFITEGFSDTVVCADLGFRTIGRPNATACKATITARCTAYWAISSKTKIIIIRDNDSVGLRGATALQQDLILAGFSKTKIICPPEKDLREWVQKEGKVVVKNYLLSDLHYFELHYLER